MLSTNQLDYIAFPTGTNVNTYLLAIALGNMVKPFLNDPTV